MAVRLGFKRFFREDILMRIAPACLACGLILMGASAAAAAERFVAPRPFPTVSVTGEGTATVTPDRAQINAGVSTEAKTPGEASEANAKLMTAVMAAARAAGVAERDVRTARFSIYPVQATRKRDEAPQIVGYRVTNHVQVRLVDIAKVGEVLDRLIAAGATDMGGIEFTASEPSKRLDEARAAAFADAKRKAELYARSAGLQVGRALSIAEEGDGPRPLTYRAGTAAAAATPIAVGEESVRVQVSVSFELLQ
jgi:uncharacterized protein YggE